MNKLESLSNLLKDLVIPFPTKRLNQRNNLALRSVVFEDNITSIASGSFQGCKNLEYVKFPKTLGEIDDDAFLDCTRLSELVFPKPKYKNTNRYLDKNAFLTETSSKNTIIFTMHEFEEDIIYHIIRRKHLDESIIYLDFDENTPETELIDALWNLSDAKDEVGKVKVMLSKAFSKLTYSITKFTKDLVFYINYVHIGIFKNNKVFSSVNLKVWDRRRVMVTKVDDRYITTPNLTGNIENNYIGEIIVPDKIDGCPVDLGFGTFFGCKYLDKVILPERMRNQVEQGFIEMNRNINIEFYD